MKIKKITNLLIFILGLTYIISFRSEDEHQNNNENLNRLESKLSQNNLITLEIQNKIKNYSILALNKCEDNFYILHNHIRANYKMEYPFDIIIFIFLGFILKYILSLFRGKVNNSFIYLNTLLENLCL